MSTYFSRIISFFMTVIAFLFPWISFDNTDADLTVALDANATTGFSWSYEIEDPSVLVLTDSEYVEDAHEPMMTGVGGTQYYYFDALSDGETDITFVYSQPWEGGSMGKTVVYTVTVSGDDVSFIINE